METSIAKRAESEVLSRLLPAMERVEQDLADLGIDQIKVRDLEAMVRQELNEFFTNEVPDQDEPLQNQNDQALLCLGQDTEAPPMLVRSFCLYALRKIFRRLSDALKVLEKGEDRKLETWAMRVTGDKTARVDFTGLRVVSGDGWMKQVLVRWLRLAQAAIFNEPEQLEQLLTQQEEGERQFTKELYEARASSPRLEQFLRALWDLETNEDVSAVIEEALTDDQVRKFNKPLIFLADLLTKKLALDPEDLEALEAALAEE